MTDKPDLAALLGSRICHDLISPIGAIGNGLELLMMDGSVSGPEAALISESVSNANARIRFFRIAYGISQGDQRLGRAEVQSVLSDLTHGGRLRIDWNSTPDLPRGKVKVIFLLLQCLETAMPYGGRVAVSVTDGRCTITGQAAKLKTDAALWDILAHARGHADVSPAQVQFPLAAEEISRQGHRLIMDLTETEIRLSF